MLVVIISFICSVFCYSYDFAQFSAVPNANIVVLSTGKVILLSAILTTVVVFSLTAYTFWAAKRGQDFAFLGPFLFASLIVLLVFAFIQVR
jgi:hypothetical protein